MRVDELDFQLPAELIAQTPALRRETARLMHYRRDSRSLDHASFEQFPSLLRRDDVLVFNDARVTAAKFDLRKSGGGRIEGLFLGESSPGLWRVMLKGLGRYAGELVFVGDPVLTARVLRHHGGGEYDLRLDEAQPAAPLLERLGRMPLPPYIKRKQDDPREAMDRIRYQTVYARAGGAVAAPTAGLHFTEELLEKLDGAGIERLFVTLEVGPGTFKPVTADSLDDHRMHAERYAISSSAAERLNEAKRLGRRIVAVGTTAARVLESQDDVFVARQAQTDIFIRPPYRWRHVGAMLTNFHLPRSTLVALVAAMVGLDEQRGLYRLAVEKGYRFFSYGDAMFIE